MDFVVRLVDADGFDALGADPAVGLESVPEGASGLVLHRFVAGI